MKLKTKRRMIWILVIIIGLFVTINVSAYIFQHQPSFGRLPEGERLKRIMKSPNYRDNKFQNLVPTSQLSEGVTAIDMARDFMFHRSERLTPTDRIPSIKTDLLNLNQDEDVLVWFGHSSYFIQISGKRILVDPVFCGHAAPVSFMMKAFDGADIYKSEDIPKLDWLIITHDHWDHLDYETVVALKDRTEKVVCSLGVGEHFQKWGFDMSRVIELDWNEDSRLADDFTISCLPTRHFSGRSQHRNTSLWVSYVLQTPDMKIYIGGDGGYGEHIKVIGERFGGIDFALIENGQYDYKWKYIHNQPEDVVRIASDLCARNFIPIHSGKFALANHPWDEPLNRVSDAYAKAVSESDGDYTARMLTPIIGEPVRLKDSTQSFKQWWKGLN